MLGKYLVIGLGGSAETFIRFLNADVERRLRMSGWRGRVPQGWRWLAIDVPHRSDVIRNGVPSDIGSTGTRVGLAEVPHEYEDYVHPLLSQDEALEALLGSLLDPGVPVPPPFKGAGRRPQVGYAVGLSRLQTLSEELQRQLVRLDSLEATDELTALSHMLGDDQGDEDPSTTAIVVSSLGGGSGAGLVQLVIELLLGRATVGAQWLRTELTTLLFTPDIFAELGTAEHDGMQANSLHTVSAILNGYEATGATPRALLKLLSPGGVTVGMGRRAAVTNFFVGGRNRKIAFDHHHKALQSTARALGRIMIDPHVATGLTAHLEANRTGAPVQAEFRIVDPAATSRAASSIGYASVSLGSEILASYAAERIAKAELETLLHGHRRERLTPNELEKDAIDRRADSEHPRLLRSVQLAREEVLEALYDHDGLRIEVEQHVNASIAARIQSDDERGERNTASSVWLKEITASVASFEDELLKRHRRLADDRAHAWSRWALDRMVAATTGCLGRAGFPVAEEVLGRARKSVRDEARKLGAQIAVDRGEIGAIELEAPLALERLQGRRLPAGDKRLADLEEELAVIPLLRVKAHYLGVAVRLLNQFDEGVLLPLCDALAEGEQTLQRSVSREHRSLVRSWSREAVPARLRPAPNERLLVAVDEFPRLLRELLSATFGLGPDDAATAQDHAVAEALSDLLAETQPVKRREEIDESGQRTAESGEEKADELERWPFSGYDDDPPRPLIDSQRRWRYDPETLTRTQFTIELDADWLLERSRRWVEHRRGALAERLRLPLADWIAAAPDHADVFADRLRRALECAAPLMSVNPSVHVRVHGRPVPTSTLYVGTIPLSPEHRIHGRLETALHAAGLSDGAIAALFDETSAATAVEINGFLHQPVHPVVIDGLFVPIQRDWQTRTTDATRSQFGDYRRTRPLPLFVPLSPARQRHLVAGWLVADLLGQLDGVDEVPGTRPLSVWTPRGWRSFPAELLGDPSLDRRDLLALAFGSLPLALASFAAQQYDELDAYMRLLDLGDGRELMTWIADGHPPQGAPGGSPPPPRRSAGPSRPESVRERLTAVRATIESAEERCRRELAAGPLTPETVLRPAARREVAPLVLAATADLRALLTS